jgi:arginase
VTPVHIIGVPLDLGAGRRGVDMGPSAFRISGLGARIGSLGRTPVDRGDVPAPIPETRHNLDERKKYIHEIARVCEDVYAIVTGSLDGGAVPLVLGGDHSLAAGSVAASADWVRRTTSQPMGLLWVDAHGDMNTPETTTSGNVHGMPLAALLGQEPAELASIGAVPSVLPQHTVLVGIRNLDEVRSATARDARLRRRPSGRPRLGRAIRRRPATPSRRRGRPGTNPRAEPRAAAKRPGDLRAVC